MTSSIGTFLFCGKDKTAIHSAADYHGRNILLSLVISSISSLFTNLNIANGKQSKKVKRYDEN